MSAIILGAAAAGLPLGAATSTDTNPLLQPWAGPFGGVPPFDRVQVAQFKPAFDAAMDAYRGEIGKIAGNPEPATFENTLVAMERSGRVFKQVRSVYGVWGSTLSSPDFQVVEREMEPRLAALSDEVIQNEKLFRRIQAVYESPELKKLTAEQQRLAWHVHNTFVRAGARLAAPAKARVAEINQRLAALYTSFSQNLLADEEDRCTVLEQETDLAGLPDSFKAAAAAEATRRKLNGKWVIANTRSSVEPFLTYSPRRDLREKVWREFVSRGENGDAHDNARIITEILALRAERAKLLGYPTQAHWRLENKMARTPERALALLEAVWKPATARVREEVADMQAIADAEKAGIRIESWDYRYYAEKVRKAKFDLDEGAIKPYLQLDKLREGMFWAATQIYGYTFTPVTSVPVYQEDVRVWEVKSAEGRHVGLFYFDPYARPGKRSGAWMNEYRDQERFERDITTIVSNNSNFMKAAPGEPVLVSWDDAKTLFHEFGHALHGLSSDVTYPSIAGTSVATDYVELPSQINERWLSTPEVLNRFALHYQTGKPMPPELVERIKKAATFNQGFATTEYLASALIDMKLHLAATPTTDPGKFEREELARLGMPREMVMRHRTPQFAHIFADEGYSAGYYSYLWADTLTADATEAFLEAGGLYDKTVATRFKACVLSVGNTVDPAEGYRRFRGRDAGIDALMRDRGFAPAK